MRIKVTSRPNMAAKYVTDDDSANRVASN